MLCTRAADTELDGDKWGPSIEVVIQIDLGRYWLAQFSNVHRRDSMSGKQLGERDNYKDSRECFLFFSSLLLAQLMGDQGRNTAKVVALESRGCLLCAANMVISQKKEESIVRGKFLTAVPGSEIGEGLKRERCGKCG